MNIINLNCFRILYKWNCSNPHRRLRSRPAPFGTASPSELLSMRLSRFYDIRNVKKETIGMYASGSYSRSSFHPLPRRERMSQKFRWEESNVEKAAREMHREKERTVPLISRRLALLAEPFLHYDSPLPLSLSVSFLPSSSSQSGLRFTCMRGKRR